MQYLAPLLVALLFLCDPVEAQAQSVPKFSTPEIKLQNGFLLISYDILNGEENDQYKINLEVTDVDGKSLRANSLTGDVGKNVSGGTNKMIMWNYAKDGVSVDEGIFVEIVGEISYRAKDEMPQEEVDYSLIDLLWRSAVYPGWGLTKATGSKLHMIKGGLGYGCIAGAFILNNAAYNNQQKLESGDVT